MTSHNGSAAPEFAPFIHQSLSGRVALVAGATHGARRAIARVFARAGAFVYCTGRSTPTRPSDYGRDETIEGTAELIRAEGGHAEAFVCDHLRPAMIDEVVRRIDGQQGRLDIVVNDIWGEAYFSRGKKLWNTDFDSGMRLVNAGLLTQLNTAHAALPLLTRRSGGLHIEITDGTDEFNASHSPGEHLSRSDEDRRQPIGVRTRPRIGRIRLLSGSGHSRMAEVGDDARPSTDTVSIQEPSTPANWAISTISTISTISMVPDLIPGHSWQLSRLTRARSHVTTAETDFAPRQTILTPPWQADVPWLL